MSLRGQQLSIIIAAALLLAATILPARLASAQPIGPTERALRQMADESEPTVVKLRGLEWKFSVTKGVRNREQLRAMLMQEVQTPQGREEIAKDLAVITKLGIVPKDYDLLGNMVKLYGSAIAGFYDPKTRELNLVLGGRRTAEQAQEELFMKMLFNVTQDQCTTVHELTHAMDDQHFDLLNLYDEKKTSTDELLAIKGLVEGTACSVQNDFMWGRRGIPSWNNPGLKPQMEEAPGKSMVPGADGIDIPDMLVKQATFPYSVGNRLVLAARKRDEGAWTTVNKMFEDLPASTEQVIHPEKYLQTPRDNPTVFNLPDEKELPKRLGADWEELRRDTYGEFMMQIYFEEFFRDRRSAKETAKKTAEGWDGDRVVVFKNKKTNALALYWVSAWDSTRDAEEYFNLYRNLMQAKYKGMAGAGDPNNTEEYSFSDAENSVVRMERRGKEVVVVESLPSDVAQNLMELGFDCERKPWTRPPHGKRLPNMSPEAPAPTIASANFNGTAYSNKANGVAIEMPRAGFVLTREDNFEVQLRAPEAERFEKITLRVADGSLEDFRATGWAVMRGHVVRPFSDRREMLDREFELNGAPAWKLVFGGRDDRMRERIVLTIAVPISEKQFLAVTVNTYQEFFNEAAADLMALVEKIKRSG